MSLDRSADRKGSGHVGIVRQWPGRFWSLARGGDGGGGPGIATSGSAAERSRPRNGLCGDGRGGSGTWRGAAWCRRSRRSGSGAGWNGPGRAGFVRRWPGRFWYFARGGVVPGITTVGVWRGLERARPRRDRAAMAGAVLVLRAERRGAGDHDGRGLARTGKGGAVSGSCGDGRGGSGCSCGAVTGWGSCRSGSGAERARLRRGRGAMGGAAAGATCEGYCSGVAPLFSPPSDIPSRETCGRGTGTGGRGHWQGDRVHCRWIRFADDG